LDVVEEVDVGEKMSRKMLVKLTPGEDDGEP